MLAPPIPADEAPRLRALHDTGLLFSPAEARFDRITEIACRTFEVPIALVSLVAESSQWFKSAQGPAIAQTARELSFCAHAILGEAPLVVTDARSDERFFDNPLVAGPPGIRFYAGQPIRHKRQPVGTLCLIDTRPRFLDDAQLAQLHSLATWVENEIDSGAQPASQRDLAGMFDPAQRQQLVDPLTGTWNRRAAAVLLPRELAAARRRGLPATIVLIDLDRFSAVNARFGRMGGDVLLAEIARRIRSAVRPQDALVRHAGKQFLLLVAGASLPVVEALAERVLVTIVMTPLPMGGEELEVSVSIGAAAVAHAAESQLAALVAGAESAVREAKADGRGCVRLRMLPAATDTQTPVADEPRSAPQPVGPC